MAKKTVQRTCESPDRDSPKLKCGYPIPCPYHTVISEPGKLTIPHGVGRRARRRVKALHAIIHEKKQ
jgi:hypothetical protein